MKATFSFIEGELCRSRERERKSSGRTTSRERGVCVCWGGGGRDGVLEFRDGVSI